ncbi:MAG TPA: hypothetical protein VJ743_20610 [Albitalea sp.]|nr:hypothetical protein [Albitalea sp.]
MISVVLLHVDREIGQRLGDTIAATPGFALAGVADNLPTLREAFAPGLPDVLIVDLRAAHVQALLADLRSHAGGGHPLILALSMSADDPRLIDALCGGAHGYFVQARSALSLPAAIEQLMRGESSMSPQIARQVRARLDADAGSHRAVGPGVPASLSEADRLLLRWTAEGYLVSEVARGLQLTPQDVGVRMRHIYRTLQFDRATRGDPAQAAGGAVSMKLGRCASFS